MVLSFFSCVKSDIDLDVENKVYVTGEVSNEKIKIGIYNISAESGEVKVVDARATILSDGVTRELLLDDDDYYFNQIGVKPGLDFKLSIMMNEKFVEYSGRVPDSLINSILSFGSSLNGLPTLNLKNSGNSIANQVVYWSPEKSFNYEFREYNDFVNSEISNFRIPGVCNLPLPHNDSLSFIYYVGNRVIRDQYNHNLEYIDNYTDPLFIRYRGPMDTVVDNTIFRISKAVKCRTNTIYVADTSTVLFSVTVVDENGEIVREGTQTSVGIRVVFPKNNSGSYLPLEGYPYLLTSIDISKIINQRCRQEYRLIDNLGEDIQFRAEVNKNGSFYYSDIYTTKVKLSQEDIEIKINL
jgi:hypothetical protein